MVGIERAAYISRWHGISRGSTYGVLEDSKEESYGCLSRRSSLVLFWRVWRCSAYRVVITTITTTTTNRHRRLWIIITRLVKA